MTPRRWAIGMLVAGLACLFATEAPARPGGGGGYSGGSSGGSSGGGGSYSGGGSYDSGGSYSSGDGGGDGAGGEAIAGLIVFVVKGAVNLTRAYPMVMMPLWIGLGLVLALRHRIDVDLGDWSLGIKLESPPESTSYGAATERVPEPARPPKLLRGELERLREADPGFSVILFEDLAHALFAKAHEARGSGRLETLRGYLQPEARALLAEGAEGLAAVEGIVVGSMRYRRVSGLEPGSDRVQVELEFEANYAEVPRAEGGRGEPRGFYARERWTLGRLKSARSRPPERARSFGCPSCGAPLPEGDAGACAYCGSSIDGGVQDWVVQEISVLERQRRAPALTGGAPEVGTRLDSIVDPELKLRRAELEARDPAFTLTAFEARVKHIFTELQPAWSNLDLGRARPYLSDNLFDTWRYWIEAYRRAGLRNVSQDARVTGMRIVRVGSDLYYDAVTVRLRASGLDFTIDANDHLVGGDRSVPREYSEYWTLIRGRGAQGPARTEKSCPRCGGPLAVNMAGDCESCGARIASGEFDWVLSRIEQDESYQG